MVLYHAEVRFTLNIPIKQQNVSLLLNIQLETNFIMVLILSNAMNKAAQKCFSLARKQEYCQLLSDAWLFRKAKQSQLAFIYT